MKSVALVVGVVWMMVAVGSCYEADEDDDFIRAVKVVYGNQPSALASFERTQEALEEMVKQLDRRERLRGALEHDFKELRTFAQARLDVCKLNRPSCELILEDIQDLKQEHPSDEWLNLGPYLESCEQRQKDYCKEPSSSPSAQTDSKEPSSSPSAQTDSKEQSSSPSAQTDIKDVKQKKKNGFKKAVYKYLPRCVKVGCKRV